MHLYHVKIAGTKATFPAHPIVSIQVFSAPFFSFLRNAASAACRSISVSKTVRGNYVRT